MLNNTKINLFVKFILFTILYSISLLLIQLSISFVIAKIDIKYIVFSYPIALLIVLICLYQLRKNEHFSFNLFSKKSSYLYLIIVPIIYNLLGHYFGGLFCKSSINSNFLIFEEINLVLSYVILGPIVEELFFRGIILDELLSNSKNKIVSIIFTSGLFCLIHIEGFEICNVLRIVDAFIFSIIISYFYASKKNIFYAIIFHIIYNLTWYLWRFL